MADEFSLVIQGFGLGFAKAQRFYPPEKPYGAPDLKFQPADKPQGAPNVSFKTDPWQDPRSDVSAVSQYGKPVLSLLGTPVFSNFNLQYGTRKLSHAINAVLFTVSQCRNIVTTTVQGRPGTVKEFIAEGDWRINAKLVISAIDQSFPAGLAREIEQMVAIPDTIQIHSWFLNDIFNIRDVVVTDKRFEQHQGMKNMCFIELEMLSDTPENLD